MTDLFTWLLACYAAGRADATGEALLGVDADALGVVDIVRADYARQATEPPIVRPAWLEVLCEASDATKGAL